MSLASFLSQNGICSPLNEFLCGNDLDERYEGCTYFGDNPVDRQFTYNETRSDFSNLLPDHRLIHTVVPLPDVRRTSEGINGLLDNLSSFHSNSIIIVSLQVCENSSHLHILHDCAYSNGSCRCIWVNRYVRPLYPDRNVERRLKRNFEPWKLSKEWYANLVIYLTSHPRYLLYYRGRGDTKYTCRSNQYLPNYGYRWTSHGI